MALNGFCHTAITLYGTVRMFELWAAGFNLFLFFETSSRKPDSSAMIMSKSTNNQLYRLCMVSLRWAESCPLLLPDRFLAFTSQQLMLLLVIQGNEDLFSLMYLYVNLYHLYDNLAVY